MKYIPLTSEKIIKYSKEFFDIKPDLSQMKNIQKDIDDIMYQYGELSESELIEIIGNIVL